MGLLEIFLLILITYALLAVSRQKKRPAPTASRRDQALEEALREVREALRSSTSERERPVWASSEDEFHDLERNFSWSAETARGSALPKLEASGGKTEAAPEADKASTVIAKGPLSNARAHFWLSRLCQRESMWEAIVLAELLGKPRARRPWRPRLGSDHIG